MAVDFARVGSDDYASRSASGFNHNAAYTALTWFKVDVDPNDYQHFIHIGGTYSYDGNTDFIGTDTDGQLFRFGCAGGASNSFLTTGAHYLTVGQWYWCALVRETSTSLKVYRGTNASDGALIATLTDNVGARSSASLMSLGGYNSANINGPIALPRFWSGSSLTLAQLHTEVGSYSPVITANLWTAPAFSGADFTAAMADLSGNARNWTRSGTDSTIVADPISPSSGASQSIAFTLDGVASAVSQTLSHSQALATTLDGVTVAVSQGLRHAQTLSATLGDISVSASQSLGHPQSLAITLDGVEVAVNQSIGAGNSQTVAFTLDGVAVAVAQVARHPQVLAVTLDDVSVSVAQGLRHGQALTATLDGISVQIAQEFSSPNKDQAIAITLDDVSALLQQIGPPPTGSPHGFVITDTAPRLWWQRKPKALNEQEAAEKVAKVVRVVERIARKQVEANQPVPAKEQKREVREAIAPLVAEMPGFDWMTVYRTILIELGRRQQEQQAAEQAQMEIARIQAMRRDEDDVLLLLMSI